MSARTLCHSKTLKGGDLLMWRSEDHHPPGVRATGCPWQLSLAVATPLHCCHISSAFSPVVYNDQRCCQLAYCCSVSWKHVLTLASSLIEWNSAATTVTLQLSQFSAAWLKDNKNFISYINSMDIDIVNIYKLPLNIQCYQGCRF